jgi:hypothetical protein
MKLQIGQKIINKTNKKIFKITMIFKDNTYFIETKEEGHTISLDLIKTNYIINYLTGQYEQLSLEI